MRSIATKAKSCQAVSHDDIVMNATDPLSPGRVIVDLLRQVDFSISHPSFGPIRGVVEGWNGRTKPAWKLASDA